MLLDAQTAQTATNSVWAAIATQFGLGLGLFYGVQKFFDLVGDRLNEDTKLEIAVWLLGVEVGKRVEPWPDTFAKLFDRVFGKRHLSWTCFYRSCLASYSVFAVVMTSLIVSQRKNGLPTLDNILLFMLLGLIGNVVPDYFSLLESRLCLNWMKHTRKAALSRNLKEAKRAWIS